MRPSFLEEKRLSNEVEPASGQFIGRFAFWFALLYLGLILGATAGCEIPIPPGPTPTPDPPPVVVTTGLRVLLVRETDDRTLPAEQQAIFTSAPFRKFLRESKATLRVWDDEVDAANESDADFRKMLELPRSGLPWIVVAGGSKTISQPLPKTVAEVQALIAGAK